MFSGKLMGCAQRLPDFLSDLGCFSDCLPMFVTCSFSLCNKDRSSNLCCILISLTTRPPNTTTIRHREMSYCLITKKQTGIKCFFLKELG